MKINSETIFFLLSCNERGLLADWAESHYETFKLINLFQRGHRHLQKWPRLYWLCALSIYIYARVPAIRLHRSETRMPACLPNNQSALRITYRKTITDLLWLATSICCFSVALLFRFYFLSHIGHAIPHFRPTLPFVYIVVYSSFSFDSCCLRLFFVTIIWHVQYYPDALVLEDSGNHPHYIVCSQLDGKRIESRMFQQFQVCEKYRRGEVYTLGYRLYSIHTAHIRNHCLIESACTIPMEGAKTVKKVSREKEGAGLIQ